MSELREKERITYTKDGKTYELSCEKIENGWILCMYVSYYEGEGEKQKYISKETKTYYKENPLEDDNKETKKEETLEAVKGLKSFMESINPTAKY